MQSIRSFLIINLTAACLLITSLSVITNLILAHKTLQTHLDDQANQIRLTFQMSSPILAKQNQYAHIPGDLDQLLSSFQTPNPSKLNKTLSENTSWKLFSYNNLAYPLSIINSIRPNNNRLELEKKFVKHAIITTLLTYPFLILAIWFIVRRSLSSLYQVRKELRDRKSSHLKTLHLDKVPFEISPLINELNLLFKRLEDAFEREKRFASDAAHELKTPLAGISAQAQMALKTRSEKTRGIALRNVIKGTNRSTHIVQQLLTLSRMMPEVMANEFTTVELKEVCIQIIANLAPVAIQKKTQITFNSPPKPLIIMGHETCISILMRNLIDNAIRYTPEGSVIDVFLEKCDDYILLKVIDNGPGIPPKLRKRVFERFFRVLDNKSTGSGLGMGIVHQITHLHNAKVTLHTPVSGKGLEVQVRFPIDIRHC